MAAALQELRTEVAGTLGRPILIDTDFTVVGDVTTIHNLTISDVIDSLWLECFNVHASTTKVLSLIVSPNDDTILADVNDAKVNIAIPPQSSIWVLQGHRVRRNSGNAYTVAAHAPSGDTTGDLRILGWITRVLQGGVTK